ncbi:MAG TPA: efflux RND transporter periplasmic adaptor subunit [Verrucomicrobiae bacterium]|nr:efflux RND transporter periplasmic adaptor subunit [Verrucomicrobiae bacterium]
MLFKRLSFYLALAGFAGIIFIVKKSQRVPPAPPPLAQPPRSPYPSFVAAVGLLEASRENVKIAAPKSGLIQQVLVQVGSTVKTGDPLFQLDNRESTAKVATMRAQIGSMKAALAAEEVNAADMEDQFARVSRLEKDRVASQDELKRKEFGLQATRARVERMRADIVSAERQAEQAQVELEVLTVRAPRDGIILQVNVRAGEFANTQSNDALLILGDLSRLQIRADVDEQNAPLVVPGQPATAFLKGSSDTPMKLEFVRVEPYVIPKRTLTGDSTERVDTRVLQIIFRLEKPEFPVYVGQQVDVFIQRPENAARQTAQK